MFPEKEVPRPRIRIVRIDTAPWAKKMSAEDTDENGGVSVFALRRLGLIPKQTAKIFRLFMRLDFNKIESEEGKGSVVSFTCRLYEVDESMLENGDGAMLTEKVLAGVTILLAEDNPFNQKLIVKLLRGYGADCLVANNGLEAIEIAGDLHVDVVLGYSYADCGWGHGL